MMPITPTQETEIVHLAEPNGGGRVRCGESGPECLAFVTCPACLSASPRSPGVSDPAEETAAGLTAARAQAHADAHPVPGGGGGWLFQAPGELPLIAAIRVAPHDGLLLRIAGRVTWQWFSPGSWSGYRLVPIDAQGRQLALLVDRARTEIDTALRERAFWQDQHGAARAQCDDALMLLAAEEQRRKTALARVEVLEQAACDRLQEARQWRARAEQTEAASAQLTECGRAMRATIAAQRAQLEDMLGDPDSLKGKALRALVQAARNGWAGFAEKAISTGSEERVRELVRDALALCGDEHAAALLAALLYRSEEPASIELSPAGQQVFVDALVDPPAPGPRLRQAATRYARTMQDSGTASEDVAQELASCLVSKVRRAYDVLAIFEEQPLPGNGDADSAVTACGQCAHGPLAGYSLCKRSTDKPVVRANQVPPNWCPGSEPRDHRDCKNCEGIQPETCGRYQKTARSETDLDARFCGYCGRLRGSVACQAAHP